MKDTLTDLLERFQILERELIAELQKKETEFFYEMRGRRARFTKEARIRHKQFTKRLFRFLIDSRISVILTVPLIWLCLFPLLLLDLVVSLYQAVCFPIYGIPKARRKDYVVMDRHRLAYLNVVEKTNCLYCGYANGLLAYTVEIAGRTEQYWCPIKHALRLQSMHSRYPQFLDYGDAEGYRQRVEKVRRAFADLGEVSTENNHQKQT